MVFKDNDGGVDYKKEFLNSDRWYSYMNEKENLIKGLCLVEVFDCYRNKVLWEVVDDCVVKEETDHD